MCVAAKNLKDNILVPYNQSGSGIPHYEGISFQRGYGLRGCFVVCFEQHYHFGKRVEKMHWNINSRINFIWINLKTAAKISKDAGKGLLHKASTMYSP
ncbi:hypothetical protein CEXT_348601 [Caerostris extrusa]|uniref:Uncharacterized protein n=1 Tax=Caerostris extrusa TaxID=172846 RepID=A0AAV4YB69_CAEEX|nr:hypothetical protein CEXT_348601 [Caerostris extrusa]